MNSGIYLIQNKANGKVYVGSAVNVERRWGEHKKLLRKGKHHSPRLQSSWNKHGEENFEFVVIEHCEPENLIKLEQFILDLLCSYERDKGYNICKTAGSRLGMKTSEETKKKIGEANKGNKYNLGKTRSPETRKKISEASKGRTHSEESKKKMSEANRKPESCKGYNYHKASGKYRARIRINGKEKYLGLYKTEEAARAAYLAEVEKVQQKPLQKAREGVCDAL